MDSTAFKVRGLSRRPFLEILPPFLTDSCWGPRYGYCGHTRQCVQHASISEKRGLKNRRALRYWKVGARALEPNRSLRLCVWVPKPGVHVTMLDVDQARSIFYSL